MNRRATRHAPSASFRHFGSLIEQRVGATTCREISIVKQLCERDLSTAFEMTEETGLE